MVIVYWEKKCILERIFVVFEQWDQYLKRIIEGYYVCVY